MTDAPLPDDLELASAYLDGELDNDERARVDASPTLLALVAELAQVRALLVSTPVVTDPSEREQAIAAALAAAIPADAERGEEPAPDNVRLLPRRYRWTAIAGSAAAAMVLAVVMITAFGSGSDDPASVPFAEDAPMEATVGGADTKSLPPADTAATLDAIDGPATVLPEVQTEDELTAYAESADAMVAPGTDTGGGTEPTTGTAATPEAMPAAGLVPVPSCLPADTQVLGAVTVQGIPGTVVRTVDGQLQVLDGECTVLLTAQP